MKQIISWLQLIQMSFDINWSTLESDNRLNDLIRKHLNSYLQNTQLPSYVSNLRVLDFDLGKVGPAITLKEITDPLDEFYDSIREEADQETEENNDNKEDSEHICPDRTIANHEGPKDDFEAPVVMPSPNDIQFLLEVEYKGDLLVTIGADLVLNYPVEKFMTLPVKLSISDIGLHSLCIVACLSKQLFLSFLCDVSDPAPVSYTHLDVYKRQPSILNKYLQNYMPGLTAKVFRTYNASKPMQDQLDLIPNKGSVAEKILKYNAANRTVAILCNHQRTVTKGHAQTVEKANNRIQELEWQKIRCKRAILQLDKDLLKKEPKYFEEIDDLTKEDEATIHKRIIDREIEKYQRKFVRENDKRKFEKEELLPESQLKEWLEKVDEKKQEFEKELKTGEVELKSSWNSVEKIKAQVEKLEQRIQTSSIQLKDKEENSQVSLGTSKINYIDPRLSVVFCKKYDVPIEKIFTKTLREKFKWAIESVDENWRF